MFNLARDPLAMSLRTLLGWHAEAFDEARWPAAWNIRLTSIAVPMIARAARS